MAINKITFKSKIIQERIVIKVLARKYCRREQAIIYILLHP